MTDEIELTPTSHIVLGLLSMSGQATPYDLKQMASRTVGEFWTLPHSQLYAEPARLARAGYLTEQQESHGRRRKLYGLTDRGQQALDDWLGTFAPEPYMLRDPALLKLFFGADRTPTGRGPTRDPPPEARRIRRDPRAAHRRGPDRPATRARARHPPRARDRRLLGRAARPKKTPSKGEHDGFPAK